VSRQTYIAWHILRPWNLACTVVHTRLSAVPAVPVAPVMQTTIIPTWWMLARHGSTRFSGVERSDYGTSVMRTGWWTARQLRRDERN